MYSSNQIAGHKGISDHDLVLKFQKVAEQELEQVTRVIGVIKIKHLIDVIDKLELEANPRDAKVGSVTSSIIESLEKTPDLFAVKSKGILIAAAECFRGDRNRYAISINDSSVEGILDGGHNTMAIGMYVLQQVLGEEATKQLKKIKVWHEFRDVWKSNKSAIDEYRQNLDDNQTEFDTLIPVELLIPSSGEVADIDLFSRALLDICAARNNNVQLRTEAFANQQGFFDDIKSIIASRDNELAERIEWRPNEGGDIKVADVISLLWIPLSVLLKNETILDEDGRKVEAPNATQLYSSKGECLTRFERLMSSPSVSTSSNGDYRRELKNIKVKSALDMAYDLLRIYDQVCLDLPSAYNKVGIYGRITAVKKMNSKSGGKTKFLSKKLDTKSPEGFLIPLVYAAKALINVKPDGTLEWKTDPIKFFQEHLEDVVVRYQQIIEVMDYDPQKVGKKDLSYLTAIDGFEKALLR